jgi:hypothetical protein
MKNFLIEIFEKTFPKNSHLFVRYLYQKYTNKLDDEMLFISKCLTKKRRFLDIGSNIGMYAYYFLDHFENVEAYEPLADITFRLEALSSDKLCVHNVAISNKQGHLVFNIPIIDGKRCPPLASLEKRDCECEFV